MGIITLSNGLKVNLEPKKDLGIVFVDVALNSGEAYERKKQFGISKLISETLLNGTKSYTKQQIDDLTKGSGGTISSEANTAHQEVRLSIVDIHNIAEQLRMLKSILTQPNFAEADLDDIKQQIKQSEESRRKLSEDIIKGDKDGELTIAGSFYGKKPDNESEIIDNISQDKMLKLFGELVAMPQTWQYQ